MFRKKWKPNATQRAEFAERMRSIEQAKSEPLPPEYKICCTGNCVEGDEIAFFNQNKEGERQFGKIIKESYGSAKQQHTFSILLDSGAKILIKGRNLYDNGVYRKEWANETERMKVVEEKIERGNKARAVRDERKNNKENDLL